MKAGDFKTILDKTSKIVEAVRALNSQVLIGIPEDENEREDATETKSEGTLNNAALAYIHENGSEDEKTPPRPFLEPGIRNAQSEISKHFKKAAESVWENPGQFKVELEKAGIVASNSAKKVINDQEGFKPISDATKKAREKKGFKGEKALIVTGQLRNAITYVVED